jgi:hypothetical protein
MAAYAAATATVASFERIREAATPNQSNKPAKETTATYREALSSLWLVDTVPAWAPTKNHFSKLAGASKHFLADPALACECGQASHQDTQSGTLAR